jgi:Cu/Ag efflux protein CusF
LTLKLEILLKTALTASFIALAAVFAMPAIAADAHNHGAMPAMNAGAHGGVQMSAAADAQLVNGTVKKIDKAAGKVTLAHGPLVNLGMDMSMTMVFRVKDASWLDLMKEGDKIRFVADKINGAFTVVQYEPVNKR